MLDANVTAENTTITLREIQKNPAETQDLLRGTVSDDDPRIAEIVNYIIDIEQDSDVYIGVKKPNILLFDENERRIRPDDARYEQWMSKL